MPRPSVDLTEENVKYLNLMVFQLTALAQEMAEANDPFFHRIDEIVIGFVKNLGWTPPE